MEADDAWTGRAVYEAVHDAYEMDVRPTVREYLDESGGNSVDIATFEQRPGPDWVTCSTVTLYAEPDVMDGENVPVELMGSVTEGTEEFAEVLSTAAFFAGRAGWLAVPGVVLPDVVRIRVPDTTTPHLLRVTPFI